MPYVTDTASPRLKAHPTAKELDEIYTPNLFEVVFAEERTRQPAPRVGLLLLLKTFQRLEGQHAHLSWHICFWRRRTGPCSRTSSCRSI
jgi:hypothetical protein